MKGSETRLRLKIVKALRAQYPQSLILKIHGNQFQNIGIPDLLCCIRGAFFGIEVKCPGKYATDVQEQMIKAIQLAEGEAAVVTSPQEALDFVRRNL